MPEIEQLTADFRLILAAQAKYGHTHPNGPHCAPGWCGSGTAAPKGPNAEPLSLLEQVDMEVAQLLEQPAWWGDDPFEGIPVPDDEPF